MKEFKIQITDEEYKIFCHGIIDPELWIKNAIAGKINNIKKTILIIGIKLNLISFLKIFIKK